MILKIRNSVLGKSMSIIMLLIFLITLNPVGSYALTGGPAQPEFNAFTPIGTSDMVDLSSGDFSYNIPLMDIGGFPINLAYSSGVTMDQEASWVGLGWDLSIGQINRQMRGLPDDFDGDEVIYENNIKDNWTVGGTFQFSPELFGFNVTEVEGEAVDLTSIIKVSVSGQYNSYTGYSFTPSLGMSYDMANGGNIGFNASSTPDGLVLSSSLSLGTKTEETKKNDHDLIGGVGVSFSSRQGITSVNMSADVSGPNLKAEKHKNIQVKGPSVGSSISFVANTYTPTVQSNMISESGTFNTAVDLTAYGFKGETEVTGFASNQYIENNIENKRAYGYEHTEKAPKTGVLDFNREKDGTFSVNSTNLPITNYTYDIYSVQGQGVSGMFHPYRSQVGYVYDDFMRSNSTGLSGGGELGGGAIADVGLDIEGTMTKNMSGIWEKNNQVLDAESFDELEDEDPDYEEVYFKNVGDLSVDKEDGIFYSSGDATNLGGYDPIRFKLGFIPYKRNLKNKYMLKGEHDLDYSTTPPYSFDPITGWEINKNAIKRQKRINRNQNILKVSNKDAITVPNIEYNALGTAHSTAGFIITRNDGARYNYGKALYNTIKKEVTFAVGDEVGSDIFSEDGSAGNNYTGLVNYETGDNSLDNGKGDHYFNRITTPAYGHTFLLTSLLSTDYSDFDEDGIPSEGDFGSYTTFQYRPAQEYQWRIPFQANKATYNEGLRTNPTDDKGSYVYGEKQITYIQKIETKTHVALFHVTERRDGYGVAGEDGGIGTDSKMYKLKRIELYSKGEYAELAGLDGNGNIVVLPSVTPIKTVHFEYQYDLCQGIPNNLAGTDADNLVNQGGKLTLHKVYFTYRNSNMGQYSSYDFNYGEGSDRNPPYNVKGYDIWGCYKPNGVDGGLDGTQTTDPLSAPEFNYVEQNTAAEKLATDDYSAAWSITDIDLPSGGKIHIDYESDDYQYVQNKKAMRMFKLVGAGDLQNPESGEDTKFSFHPENESIDDQTNTEALLYKGIHQADYLYIKLDEEDQTPLLSDAEFQKKYLKDIYDSQDGLLQFRMFLNMTKDGGKKAEDGGWKNEPFDYVSGYLELASITDCKVFDKVVDGETVYYGSIRINKVDMEGGYLSAFDVNPISKAGWQYARKFLSKYVYGLPNMAEDTPHGAALNSVYTAFENMGELFAGANGVLHGKKIAKRFIPEKSWIRLSEPTIHKKGGGCRVKRLDMTDEWAGMTGATEDGIMDQEYGQEYTYILEDGGSSGVATYEPVGSKENPLVQPIFVNTNRLLAPDDDNYMEKPFGESFFPGPAITYSRVSVKNIEREEDGKVVKKHATGRVITTFYTSKDFPTIADQTELRMEEDYNPLLSKVFSINVVKHLTLTQGYVVHLNDMNGKMRSQRVYAEGQSDPISGVDYNYDLKEVEDLSLQFSNQGKIDNKVNVLYPDGHVENRNLGVEFSVINDFREMKSVTKVVGVDGQTNTFNIGPVPLVVPSFFPKFSRHVNKLNIATTTKVVNTFGVMRETVAYDAGASVSTRNLLWDSETGEVLITETVNEYGDKYYSFNFPAHWMYKGMGQAAFNSGLRADVSPEGSGFKITGETEAKKYVFPGDEVLLKVGDETSIAWVSSVSEGTEFSLINSTGETITGSSAEIYIFRSGHRNIQSTSMGSIVMQINPYDLFDLDGGVLKFNTDKLKVILDVGTENANHWSKKRIVNAGAVEFREDWELQCECGIDASLDIFNPYRYNTLGVWRANKSHLYLTGRQHNAESDPRNDGFYNTYQSFYERNGSSDWSKYVGTDWTSTSEVTQYSPYGFELENQDALDRYSSAQYGYNFSFPLAVAANSAYQEMGFDGFEDYNFDGCAENEHFGFRDVEPGDPDVLDDEGVNNTRSHTGRYSIKVGAAKRIIKAYRLNCE